MQQYQHIKRWHVQFRIQTSTLLLPKNIWLRLNKSKLHCKISSQSQIEFFIFSFCSLCRFDRVQLSLLPKSHSRSVWSWVFGSGRRLAASKLVQQQPEGFKVSGAERKRSLNDQWDSSVYWCAMAAWRGDVEAHVADLLHTLPGFMKPTGEKIYCFFVSLWTKRLGFLPLVAPPRWRVRTTPSLPLPAFIIVKM